MPFIPKISPKLISKEHYYKLSNTTWPETSAFSPPSLL
jgi:hypothetical protein